MTKFFAPQAVSLALAAAVTLAAFGGTNALAGHQYRLASAARQAAPALALDTQYVVVVGHHVVPA